MKHNTIWMLVSAIFMVAGFVNAQAQSGQPSVDRSATLLVDTDDTCQLFVDDEDKGEITPDKALKSTVGLGDHILKCKIKSAPDVVWRKVINVKDTSQVAEVVALRPLHLQYDQMARAKNDPAAVNRQLEETDAQLRLRQKAATEMPQMMFDLVKGNWQGMSQGTADIARTSESYQYHFAGLENGHIVAYLTLGGTMRYKETFTPVPPNRLQGETTVCVASTDKQFMKSGSKKDAGGWADCWGKHNRPPEPYAKDAIIQINGSTLTYSDPTGSFTLTR
ncbi:MAG TPA: hypothetical protein VGK36_24570 [Candidatus Angelobacter sp.]